LYVRHRITSVSVENPNRPDQRGIKVPGIDPTFRRVADLLVVELGLVALRPPGLLTAPASRRLASNHRHGTVSSWAHEVPLLTTEMSGAGNERICKRVTKLDESHSSLPLMSALIMPLAISPQYAWVK
jgi:hypothetical protein